MLEDACSLAAGIAWDRESPGTTGPWKNAVGGRVDLVGFACKGGRCVSAHVPMYAQLL